MKRRIVSVLLTLLLLFTATPLAPAALAYSDSGGSWAASVMDKAGEYGLMQGYPDGRFGVGEYLSRAEFVTVLCRMFGWEAVSPESPSFIDCPADQWYAGYVEAAQAHNVMDKGGAFRPEDDISREEIAVMLVRALGYNRLAQSLSDVSLPFSDVTGNQGYIAMAYDFGIITGIQANDQLQFRPSFSAYREEAAAMLVRAYERLNGKLDWLHGFYALSSYSQIDLTAKMDSVSVGWARMEYDPATGPRLNFTSANGNDWVRPQDPTPATSVFARNHTPYNLSINAPVGDKLTLPDGTVTYTIWALLSTPEARAQAIAAILDGVSGYAGVTIDFEGLRGDSVRTNFVAFLTELRAALDGLGTGKTLYVCVQPDTWYDGYDYRGIGTVCDKVILMAHDYQWTSVPDSYVGTAQTDSPVTPFPQIYEALRDITDPVTGVEDRSRIALAISFGTAGFHVDADGKLLETAIYHPAQETLAKRLAQPDTTVTYSDKYRNPAAVYTTEDGNTYRVWYENEQSVLDKLALSRMFGIGGVSLWRIGNIPTYSGYDVWSAVLSQR